MKLSGWDVAVIVVAVCAALVVIMPIVAVFTVPVVSVLREGNTTADICNSHNTTDSCLTPKMHNGTSQCKWCTSNNSNSCCRYNEGSHVGTDCQKPGKCYMNEM